MQQKEASSPAPTSNPNAADMLATSHTAPIRTGKTIPPMPQPALMMPAAPALASGKRPVACATSVDQIGP